MKISHTTKESIQFALDTANKSFDNNLTFRRFDAANKAATAFTVTLTVKSSKAEGARYNPINGHRVSAACWHAHGTFLDALNKDAIIRTAGKIIHPHDTWQDWNIGSQWRPYHYSEACLC